MPDFIPATGDRPSVAGESEEPGGRCLRGISISGGTVEGPVVVVRGGRDIAKVRRGDIVVVAVIDPGMAAMLGLAAGLIAEMGGTLSHGAIIVREYGIPAVVNIPRATELLKDGDRVVIDAVTGLVQPDSA